MSFLQINSALNSEALNSVHARAQSLKPYEYEVLDLPTDTNETIFAVIINSGEQIRCQYFKEASAREEYMRDLGNFRYKA